MKNVVLFKDYYLTSSEIELSEEEKRYLHYALFLTGRRDSRPALIAAARSDIPVLPDIIARCIKNRHKLSLSGEQEIMEGLESIVLSGLDRYEEVVFPQDRMRHKNLVRGTAFISGIVTEFCSLLSPKKVKEECLGGRNTPESRKWAYELLVGDRQKAALKKESVDYAKAIILDCPISDV